MPDLSFLQQYATNPLQLGMLILGALFALYIWKGGGFNKQFKDIKDKIDDILESIDLIHQHDVAQDKEIKTILLNHLRKTIFDERVPISDRIAAAIRYTRQGGNSDTKQFIENKLKPENTELFQTLEKLIQE